jgi:hypothetical protein
MIMIRLKAILLVLLIISTLSCSDSTTDNQDGNVRFEFVTTGDEHFFASTSNPDIIEKARQQLALPEEERNLFINGEIERGTNQNNGWSWHFVPGEWDLVEASIEVCDGRPSDVEEDLDYWVDNVGRFCPWSSQVVREVDR